VELDKITLLVLFFQDIDVTSEGQKMGAIAPAPENARKKICGAWSIVCVKVF
jgi:hypothetical protein